MPVQTVIKHRRSAAATWTSTNPVLAAGELGLETDTRKVKYGDGTTAWTSLQYAAGGASVLVGTTAPTGVEPNTLWWNSETGSLYIYYDSTWVAVVQSFVGPAGPAGPQGPTANIDDFTIIQIMGAY